MSVPTTPAVAADLFVLGAALGLLALPISAYVAVSPRWLRASLLACSALLALRYFLITVWLGQGDPRAWWSVQRLWPIHLVALTWPAAVAADQLIRHPAMTPRTLVRWYAPFALAALGLLGISLLTPDRLITVTLWARIAGGLLAGFAMALLVIGVGIRLRMPQGPGSTALVTLLVAYALAGLEGIVQAIRPSPVPWFWPEMFAFVALWCAFQTARQASM